MPIVDIEIVLRAGENLRSSLAGALADALGEIFAAPPRTTWVRLRSLPADDFAENGGRLSADGPPVFVSILKRKRPAPSELQPEVDRITAAVARICSRSPGHVHIIYEPDGAGRVAFGGRIVE